MIPIKPKSILSGAMVPALKGNFLDNFTIDTGLRILNYPGGTAGRLDKSALDFPVH